PLDFAAGSSEGESPRGRPVQHYLGHEYRRPAVDGDRYSLRLVEVIRLRVHGPVQINTVLETGRTITVVSHDQRPDPHHPVAVNTASNAADFSQGRGGHRHNAAQFRLPPTSGDVLGLKGREEPLAGGQLLGCRACFPTTKPTEHLRNSAEYDDLGRCLI